jgi:hypothetical protein
MGKVYTNQQKGRGLGFETPAYPKWRKRAMTSLYAPYYTYIIAKNNGDTEYAFCHLWCTPSDGLERSGFSCESIPR